MTAPASRAGRLLAKKYPPFRRPPFLLSTLPFRRRSLPDQRIYYLFASCKPLLCYLSACCIVLHGFHSGNRHIQGRPIVCALPIRTAPIEANARRTLRLKLFVRLSALGNAQSIASLVLHSPS